MLRESGKVLLQVKSVSRYHLNTSGQSVPVFQGLELVIHPGEVVALIGPSGSGKTTLLRLLNRLEDVDAGLIEFCGRPLNWYNPLELRRQIGLVFQKPYMFPGTVRSNLEYPSMITGTSPPSVDDITDVLRTSSVDPAWLDQSARKLSIGQQQRVSLARTLLNRPKLLLLDEPTSSLDPDTADQVVSRLTAAIPESDSSLLFVTHDHQLARKYATRVLTLRDGHLVDGAEEFSYAEN